MLQEEGIAKDITIGMHVNDVMIGISCEWCYYRNSLEGGVEVILMPELSVPCGWQSCCNNIHKPQLITTLWEFPMILYL